MVRSIGLEPTTPTMSRWCSNQLSYERNVLSVTTGTNISGTAPKVARGKMHFSLIAIDSTRLCYASFPRTLRGKVGAAGLLRTAFNVQRAAKSLLTAGAAGSACAASS